MYNKAIISYEDRGDGAKYWVECLGWKSVYYFDFPELEELMKKAWDEGEGKGD